MGTALGVAAARPAAPSGLLNCLDSVPGYGG